MTICTIGTGEETEKYTCPSHSWDTENIYCCGLNVAQICCAEEQYRSIADHSQEFVMWELVGHVLSLTMLVVIGITCCVSCYCCPCCPAYRWRMTRGRVIRTADAAVQIPMRQVATAPTTAPPPQQYPAAGYTAGYTAGYQMHPPPPGQHPPFPQPTAPPYGPVAFQPAGQYGCDPPPPYFGTGP